MIRCLRWIAVAAALGIAACTADPTSAPRATLDAPSRPAGSVVAAPTTTELFIYPSILNGGGIVNAQPEGEVVVPSATSVDRTYTVTSGNPAVVALTGSTVTVKADSTIGYFGMRTSAVATTTVVPITVVGDGLTLLDSVMVYPTGATLPTLLQSIVTNPLTVAAGSSSAATVTLVAPAPVGGLLLALYSNLPLSAQIQTLVRVPSGATAATVPITTSIGFPNSTTTVAIKASAGATTVETGLNVVTGAATTPPPLQIASVSLSPSTVVGGTSVQGTVTMNAAAPSGGALVTLQSSDTTVATTPASVVVPAGTSSATFPVATRAVAAQTSANISGGFGGGFLTTTLVVTPASASPPPSASPLPAPSLVSPAADTRFPSGATVSFDWSDVSGAASYTFQIATSDKFDASSTILVNATTTQSAYTAAGLPTATLWWRVRAVSSTGAAGSWSGVRRFELK